MTQAVTELIVRGDNALTVLDQFEDKMEGAGRASDRTTGAVADFTKRMEVARQAIERGNAITTQSIERKSAEQRAWDKWSATVDRTQALRIRLEREAMQAAVAASNAVNLGYTSQEEALMTLTALEQRHAVQLRAITEQHQSVTIAATTQAAANDNLAMSMNRVAAANDNASFSTANVAAQFQDVAVTAAMGMNPIMIALQQGTQLSSVLATMKNPIMGLVGAFTSLFNPVSLLTIGFVALAAAAIQFFVGAKDDAAEASGALKDHNTWLDEILVGYKAVRDVAREAAEASLKLPEGVVTADLKADLFEQEAAAKQLEERIVSLRQNLRETADVAQQLADTSTAAVPVTGADVYIAQLRSLQELNITASSTREELESVMIATNNLFHTTDDPAIKVLANDFFKLAQQLWTTAANAKTTETALRALASVEFNNAATGLADLMPDFRDRFTQMRDEAATKFGEMKAQADNPMLMKDANALYSSVLGGIDRLERETEAKKAASAGKPAMTDAEKMIGNYADLTRGATEFISAQQLEAQTLGMTGEAANRMRYEQDMLNHAANDNIALLPAQREEISALAAQMSATEETTRRLTESYEFGRSTLSSFLGDFRKDLMNGTSLWDAFANAAGNALDSITDRLMKMASDQLFNTIFGMLGGGGFGTIGVGGVNAPAGGFTPGLTGPRLFASGGYTGDLATSSAAGVVHGQEYVLNAAATRSIGVPALNALNAGRTAAVQGQQGASGGVTRLELIMPEGWRAEIIGEANSNAIEIVQMNEKARSSLYYAGGNPR